MLDRLSLTDTSLVEQAQEGSRTAEDELYRRYSERLIGLARKKWPAVLNRNLDPEDVVQSAMNNFFLGMRRGLYQIDDSSEVWGLLMVITLNKIRSKHAWYLAAKRDSRRIVNFESALIDLPDDSCTAEPELHVTEILERLPSELRQIVELRLQGFDVAAVAETVGRSKRTVERLLNDCRSRLNEMLQDSNPDL